MSTWKIGDVKISRIIESEAPWPGTWHNRSDGTGGSTGGGAIRGASAPSAGGSSPPDADDTNVEAHSAPRSSLSSTCTRFQMSAPSCGGLASRVLSSSRP